MTKGFDAILPEYNCFISMTISVESLKAHIPPQTTFAFATQHDCSQLDHIPPPCVGSRVGLIVTRVGMCYL